MQKISGNRIALPLSEMKNILYRSANNHRKFGFIKDFLASKKNAEEKIHQPNDFRMKKKNLWRLVFVVLMIWMSSMTAFADSIEIASVTAHYAHPITGKVEDSGNDIAIGQGMTESVLDPQALIETDGAGKIYGSFRLHLADQIKSYKIAVQKNGDGDFYSVSPKEMQRGTNSIDFRIPLPSKDSIIRIDAHVNAMGRSVIFYGKIGSRVEGNTDFIVSVDPSKKTESAPVKEEGSASEASPQTSSSDIQTESATSEEMQNAEIGEKIGENAQLQTSGEKPLLTDTEHGLLMKGDPRLDGEKEKIHTEEEPSVEVPSAYGPITMMMLTSLATVIGMIAVLTFLSGLVLMIGFYKLRKINDLREAERYGFKPKTR